MDIFKIFGTIAIKGVDQAKEDLKDTSKEAVVAADGVGKAIDNVIEFSAKVAAATTAAVTAIGGLAMASSNGMEEALDSFVSATDVSSDALTEYEDVLKSIYKKNYGESFEDIAKAMATVKQQAGDISAEELEAMTIDAIVLRDTFEFEVNESMRAAKMLMNQFGLSGKQAYNLIAQGAKSGLDKNGDLLDSINEYSVHYKQLGFTAEDFFNSLQNGTEAGTFSVDKLGDAMKEFGIRVKDGSDTSREAFVYLGYDADQMFQIFNDGGEAAAIATQDLIDRISAMPDGVEKTTAGVALFGTMWEDLGDKGIKALGELDGGISITKEALESINDTKYDNMNSRLEGVKRKLESTIITPLGKKLQPTAEKFIKYIEKKIPSIQKLCEKLGDKIVDIFDDAEPAFTWLIDDALPFLIDILGFVIEHFELLAVGIGTAVAAFKTMQIISVVSTAIEGASGAMGVFNAVMSANPIGLVVTAIGGLVVALGALSLAQEDEESQLDETKEKIELERTAREEKIAAIEAERKAIEEKAEAELIEVANTEALWKELQTLVDENGNVTEANKARAEFILDELNTALGTEYELNELNKESIAAITEEINNLIQTKKAEILLDAQEEKYKNAVNNVQAEQNNLAQASINLSKQKEKTNKAELTYLEKKAENEKKIAEIRDSIDYFYDSEKDIAEKEAEITLLENATQRYKEAWESEKLCLDEKQAEYNITKHTLEGYYTDMATYENAQSALIEGNIEDAIDMLDYMGRTYQTAADLASVSAEDRKKILEEQVIQAETTVELIEAMLAKASEEEKATYERQLQSAREYAEKAKEEYYLAGGDIVESYAEGAEDSSYILGEAIEGAIDNIIIASGEKKAAFAEIGRQMVAGITEGVKNEEPQALKTMSTLMNGFVYQSRFDLDIHSPSDRMADEVGAYIPSGIAKGVEKNKKAALDSIHDVVGQMTASGRSGISEGEFAVSGAGTQSIIDKLDQLINAFMQQKIYLNGDVLVGELAPAMDSTFGNMYAMAERGQ